VQEEEDLETQGKQDYQESEFAAGVEHQKKRAIEAAKIIIDRFYDSGFNPTIDYLKLFIENL
jgi:predicted hydrolase (HD superfamily)